MFDIHYHLLFGLDDGPKSIEESINLAEISIREGVTHIVASPHANSRYRFNPEINRERLQQINERLDGRLTLGLGCDFHLSYENIEALAKAPSQFTINGKQYLLVEFPDFGIPPSINEAFYEMSISGVVPIITHPERNPTLQAEPFRLIEWLKGGCLIQVTAGSLSGRFGRRAGAMAVDLVRKNWVHFIASDAHSPERRPPGMKRAYEFLDDEFGREIAQRLCIENPRAAFLGEGMPPQPEPVGVFEDSKPKRGFLKRLFGSF